MKRYLSLIIVVVMFLQACGSSEIENDAKPAIKALNDLNSVTSVGVNYPDYMRKLQETKIVVDQFLRKHKDSNEKLYKHISDAMGYYTGVVVVWENLNRYSNNTFMFSLQREYLEKQKYVAECSTLQKRLKKLGKDPAAYQVYDAFKIGVGDMFDHGALHTKAAEKCI